MTSTMSAVLLMFTFCASVCVIECSPFYRVVDQHASHYDHESCYYESRDSSIHYGVCTSIMGPDGCCLEGHYQPGVCSNLGHICCVKPDYDCSEMSNNKAITRQLMAQHKAMFRDKNSQPSDTSIGHRMTRSPVSGKHQVWRKTNFEVIEMPAHMTLDAVTFVNNALEQQSDSEGNFDEAAEHLCRMLDQKYPEPTPWACFVGRDYGYSIESAEGKYMLFYIGNVERIRVMAFASKTPTITTTTTTTTPTRSTTNQR